MFNLYGNPASPSCERTGRRDFLRVGGLTCGGLALGDFLRARAAAEEAANAAASQKSRAPAQRAPKAKSAILLWLPGGPSHIETWDPKPEAPVEVRGPFGAMSTALPGVAICDLFPRLAGIADRFSLIRSCCHGIAGHGGAERWVMTGYPSRSQEFELPHDYPTVGPVVARMRGPNHAGMPAQMAVPPSNKNHAAYLGAAYNPLPLYSNGRLSQMRIDGVVPPQRLTERWRLRQSLDRLRRDLDSSGALEALDTIDQQVLDLITGNRAQEAFDAGREPDSVRERYGAHEWGKCCLLARRLVEAGTTFVTVSVGSWDQHGQAGGTIADKYAEYAPQVDQAVSALLDDLEQRGLLEETLVYLLGEFGRTPRINSTGGRDHWPQAMSVLLTGGGLNRGVVVGATNGKGEHPVDRMLSPGDLLATIYHQLGVDYHHEFTNGEGRPVRLLSEGKPIAELCG